MRHPPTEIETSSSLPAHSDPMGNPNSSQRRNIGFRIALSALRIILADLLSALYRCPDSTGLVASGS
eukprot:scaffold124911_cov36-Tisochrysis_lutea.AAC.6